MSELETAKQIAKPFEGLKLKPYLCPAGIPTIGRGTTVYPNGGKVTLNDPPITEEQADEFMDFEMRKNIAATIRYCPGLILYPERWGAIADFVYNLGVGRLQTSTLRRRINQGNMSEAVKELKKWVRGGGKVLPGLVLRRETEAVFLRG